MKAIAYPQLSFDMKIPTTMTFERLPRGARFFILAPQSRESGFLYFCIEPWSQNAPVWLKVPSKSTRRAVQYWLRRISNWHDTGIVTHLI